ncbi:hypothetical protein BCR42DRAFT_413135 [Absidia repens]|uniref:Uncharacterized protein n=1 Tax=Absidia repens TaxID=90262 RepID=A0A1X2IKP3_9FUNG|nr:hypothetical protein BCR42DRAFT_413135 [Absidia repens]
MNPDNSPESNYVDVMNLYIKNLDPKVTNTELFNAFRAFGRIVSARVMTNPANNQSKGYGFVSYGRSDEARMALEQMNGKLFYQKPLVVSYHAPKKPRQAPQASPPPEYSSPYQEFRQQHQQHQHDITSPTNNSTINGLGIDNVDQIAMDIKDLSIGQHYPSVPPYPIQRKLSGADNYMAVRMSPPFSSSPISGSTGHSLASLASGLSVQQPPTQHQHYQHQHQHQHSTPTLTSVPGLSQSSSPPPQLSGGSTGRLPSDYKHTSDGRPTLRRKSSLESVSTVMTESSANLQRHKLTQAVLQCDVPFDNHNLVSDIVDMLLTLKKRERSLCLFNQDFIKAKIQLALEALEIFHDGEDSDEDDDEEKALQRMLPRQPMKKKSSPLRSTPTAATQTTATAISLTTRDEQHSTKLSHSTDVPKSIPARASKAIPIVAPPAIVSTTTTTSLPTNSNKKKVAATAASSNGSISENKAVIDSLMKAMENKPIHEKKQLLGDRLFPLVKATGTKQAPKVTIALLDSVDLPVLANMMFDRDALKKQVDVTFTGWKHQQQQQQQQQQ